MTTLNNLTNIESYMDILSMNSGMKVSVSGEQLVVPSDVFNSKRKCAMAMVDIANRHNTMILEGKVNYTVELTLSDGNTSWLNDRIHDISAFSTEWAVYNVLDSLDIVTKGQIINYVAEGQVVTITVVNPKLEALRKSFNKQSTLFYDEILMARAEAKEKQIKERQERKARKLAEIEAAKLEEARMTEVEKTMVAIDNNEITIEDALAKLNPTTINNPSKDYSIGGIKRIADRNRKAYRKLQGFKYSELAEENGLVVMREVGVKVVKEVKVAKKQEKVIYKEGDKGYTAPKGYATPKAPQNSKIEKIARLAVLNNEVLNKVINNFSYTVIEKDNNNEFTLRRTWKEEKIDNLNMNSAINMVCKSYNKINSLVAKYTNDKKKQKSFILKDKKPMPRVDVDYNQIILGSFDVENNSFVAENESLYSVSNRNYSTTIKCADRSASVGTNKLNGGIAMNLQLLANNNTNEEMIKVLKKMKREQLEPRAKSLGIKNVKKMNKDKLVEEIARKTGLIECSLSKRSLDSSSRGAVEDKVTELTSNKYDSVVVVERFNMNDKTEEILPSMIHQNGKGIRIVEELGEKDYSVKNYIFQNVNDEDEVMSTQIVRVDKDNKNYKINGVILVNIKEALKCEIQRRGAFIAVDEKGKKYLTMDETDKNIISNRYVFAGTNTSGKKHCSFFMKELSEDYTKEDLFKDMDKLTGGAWSYTLKELDEARRSGEKLVTSADYAKINERVGLVACSPMLKGTTINSLFIINNPIDCGPQFDENDEAFMEENHFEIPRNVMDGCSGGVSYKVFMRIFARYGIEITKAQAMRISMQTRTTVITDKRLAIPQDENMTLASIISYIDMLVTEDNDPITLVDFKRGIVLTGREIKRLLDIENLSSNEKLSKEEMKDFHWIKRVLRDVELITSKDEAKMINWDALNISEPCESPVEMFVLDASKISEAKHSNQMLNKTVKTDREATCDYMEAQTVIDLLQFGNDMDRILTFDKNGRIKGQALDNIYAVNYNRAVTDKMAFGNKLSTFDSYILSKVGKANVKANSYYAKIATFDASLFESKHVVTSKEIEYQTEEGEIIKVTLNIVYNPVMDEDIKAKEALIDELDITDEQKRLEKEALRVSINIKYPAQGTKEYGGSYIISLEELTEIIRSTDLISSSFNKAQAIRKIKYCPYNVLYMFGDSGLLVQCAGSDCDGDAMTSILNQLNYLSDSDVPTVGAVDIMNNKKILGYVSMALKRNAKELATATVIGRYDPNKEAQKKQNKKRNSKGLYNREESKAVKNIKGVVRANNIINDETLESSQTTIFEDARKLVEGKECIISSDMFMKLEYIPKEWIITDFMGLYQATTIFGDEVGITIVLVSVLTMCDTEYFFQNNKFNFEAASDLLIPLKNAVKNSKGSRKTERYTTVFTEENKRIITATNTSGITRKYIAVLNESINEWCDKVSMLPEDTTAEEWLQLVADFDIIGRNLGETSIDICKDYNKKNDKTIKDLINDEYRCVGNMKPSFLSSNLNDILYHKKSNYSINCGRFSPEVKDPTILPDGIGAIKLTIKEIAEQFMKVRVKAYQDENKFNLKSYSAYSNIINRETNQNTTDTLLSVLQYIKVSNNKENQSIAPKLDKEILRNIEGAMFNMARLENLPEEEVIAIGIQLSFMYESKKTDKKTGDINKERIFNSKMTYASLLKQVAALFPEIFLAEYVSKGNKTLHVVLDYDFCDDNFFNGDIIEFKDGWNKERTIHVKNNYTGKAIVENDNLFAIYNPYEKVTNNNWIIIPICNFLDEEAGKEYIENEREFRICKKVTNKVTNEFELVLTNTDKTKSLAVTGLNNLEGLSGKVYKNASVIGYSISKEESNYFVIAQM